MPPLRAHLLAGTGRPTASGPFHAQAAAAGLALLVTSGALWAQPAAVLPGLWEVQLLTTYEQGRTAAAASTLPPPRRRIYRMCLSPDQARLPVSPPAGARQAEVVYGRSGISGSYADVGPDGQPRAVEFAYHRLDATRFEGSHDAEGPGLTLRTQYLAQRVAPTCGPLAQAATGTPAEP